MSEKDIEKKYKEKIKLINRYNKFYFAENNPVVSDQEYDELKEEILSLESNNKFLKSKKSPSENVGYKPSKNFKKITHRVPMLSLANAFGREDLINFEKKYLTFYLKKIFIFFIVQSQRSTVYQLH